MPRDRMRVPLESGPTLDLARMIPKGSSRPGTRMSTTWRFNSGEEVRTEIALYEEYGTLQLWFSGRTQSFELVFSPRRLGGRQWYVLCPKTRRRVRVLYRPAGAWGYASRHAWGRQVAYQSQFLDPVGRAWRTKAKVKARLIGTADPDEWDLPPKPKGMRWATYDRWEAKYNRAEEALDDHLTRTVARFLARS